MKAGFNNPYLITFEPILNFVCGGHNMAKGAKDDRRHEETTTQA